MAGPPQVHDVPRADEFVRKNQHGDALVHRVGRGVRKAVGSSGDARTRAEIGDFLGQPVGGIRQITVVSVRGGAGKTTVAALLATELARHRSDRVLAMDADAELGSLPLRLGVQSEASLFDLVAQRPRTFEEAARYLRQTRDGLWVLAATRGGRITGEITFETYQAAFSTVSRYVSTAVTDCSAGVLTELHRGILGQSHGVVLVTPGTVDGALSARSALEWFSQGARRGLLPRTVIAIVSHAPQVGADLERATEMLTAWGTPVVQVPYDRHLATGAAVDMSRLGDATRKAAGRIAYEAFARSLGVHQEPGR
ncbi:MinD-like ATPase involved in chromosome partitioning or flagellar assembly [Actinomadura pelletieri DSM 43383]|uniref:MinD-like ATPase involved in chromosome partitioning or flagellar assembly n=1 Tax=Actinomadura pelletieri DSM 43383 TaxID=1120940 RepID=A0A495QGT7_9ACTN|nr:MinD-like ATPase involved in chromosome partitioning or flagellar assembly [Actinomadura pelletieri DSM 43383]